MSEGKDDLSRVNPDVTWPLPQLERVATARKSTTTRSDTSTTLSEGTQLLLQKEKTIPKQVHIFYIRIHV